MELMQAKAVLETAGYEVEEMETLKGSVMVKGLTLGSGNIRPTIYSYSLEQMEEEEEVLRMADAALNRQPEINIELVLTKDYILSNAVSCVRHQTDDERAVKWPVYGDLEEYLRINLGTDSHNENMSIVVTQQILDNAEVSADEVRACARRNLAEQVTIESMASVLSGILGRIGEKPEDDLDAGVDLWVGSNESRLHGASIMLLQDVMQKFCEEHGFKGLWIIPSSLHEVLFTPDTMDPEAIDSMIVDVNSTQVDPWDVLSSHTYHFSAA